MSNTPTASTSPLYDHLRLPGDRLALRKLAGRNMTSGGLHTPETSDDEFHYGIVERLSDGAIAGGLAAGDLVLYGKYAGTHVRLGGVERIVMSLEEVQGIVPAAHVELRIDADGKERLAEDVIEPIVVPSLIVPAGGVLR